MAFIQYLKFDEQDLPLPDSYDLDISDVEADSSGETEAGTTQRDVVRTGVISIAASFSVSPRWLKILTAYSKKPKIAVKPQTVFKPFDNISIKNIGVKNKTNIESKLAYRVIFVEIDTFEFVFTIKEKTS